MTKAFLLREVERVNRNLLSIALSILAVLASCWYVSAGEFRAVILGAPELRMEEVLSAKPRTLATINADRVIDTTHREGRHRLVALAVGERLLLSRVPIEITGARFEGKLEPLPKELREDVIVGLEEQYPATEGRFLPVMLDATGFRARAIILGVAWLALTLLAGFGVWRSAAALHDNFVDPSLQALERFGPRRAVVDEVERAYTSEKRSFDYATLSGEWLVLPGVFDVKVARLQDVVWFYEREPHFKSRWLGAADYTLVIHDAHNCRMTFQNTRENVEHLLWELQDRAPWAVSGHTPNMEMLWRVDRRAFVDEVKARQQSHRVAG